jgi:hypothetical protein
LPSLAQIFGTFGSPIDLAQSGAEHKDLQGWTREIVGQIESIPGHEERWKLLVIAPGLHVSLDFLAFFEKILLIGINLLVNINIKRKILPI